MTQKGALITGIFISYLAEFLLKNTD